MPQVRRSLGGPYLRLDGIFAGWGDEAYHLVENRTKTHSVRRSHPPP